MSEEEDRPEKDKQGQGHGGHRKRAEQMSQLLQRQVRTNSGGKDGRRRSGVEGQQSGTSDGKILAEDHDITGEDSPRV